MSDVKDWRDPTEEELASARVRYSELPPDRLFRLARAEAHQVDMGIPQPKPRGRASREVEQRDKPNTGDFAVGTKARSDALGTGAADRAYRAVQGESIGVGKKAQP